MNTPNGFTALVCIAFFLCCSAPLSGADTVQAEGIYAATVWNRQCLSEAVAEKVDRGELREEQAIYICRQILRETALKLLPTMNRQLWRD